MILDNRSPAYQAVIALLIKSGADVNATTSTPFSSWTMSLLENATRCGTAATVKQLISAGAVGLDRALRTAIFYGKPRNCTPLLRAGAALPSVTDTPYGPNNRAYLEPYLQKIHAAGSYKAYENAHRQRLVAIFAPKFPHLPADMLGRVLEFVFDVGGH